MFINCPYCRALITTDVATDLPPELCPQCKGPLREPHAQTIGVAATPSLSADGTATTTVDIVEPHIDSTEDHSASEHSRSEHPASAHSAPEHPASEHSQYAKPHSKDTQSDAMRSDDTQTVAAISLTQIEAATMAAASAEPASSKPTVSDTVSDEDDATDEAILASATSVAPVRTPMRRRAGQVTPSFARTSAQTAEASHARAWPAIAAIVGLSGLLILQMLLADRARLAADARWRPLLETLCGALSCDLPPWREPGAFTLLQRDVRQHPTALGALRVTASFRNDARWSQPWPTLQLTLSDVNGRPSGQRSFDAREYLGGAPAQQVLASGETATVAMDIVEPAAQIVAYDVRFR
jgi:hypothetical protein